MCVVASGFFGDGYGAGDALPSIPLNTIENVPLLFGEPSIQQQGNTLVIHADIIASAYFLLTRYEEWVRPDVRDEHGRFPGRQSLLWRAGILHRPIVDEYRELLKKWLRDVGAEVTSLPASINTVYLTHDVDTPCSHDEVRISNALSGSATPASPQRRMEANSWQAEGAPRLQPVSSSCKARAWSRGTV